MKTPLVVFTLLASVMSLTVSNPQEIHPYTQALSHEIHDYWCQHSDDEWCEAIAPFSRPVLPLLLYPYTTSRNWWLFTTFHTSLPCIDIYGLGLAGQHFFWPRIETSTTCPPLVVSLD